MTFAPNHDEALELVAYAERYNEWVLSRARPYLGPRVLDFGAGIGTFTEMLAASSDMVVAVEPEPEFAASLERRFRDRTNVQVVEAEAKTLGHHLESSVFDAVVCFNVLEHIFDDAGALTAVRSCLRLGGHLLLLVPAHPFLYGSIDHLHGHERRYERRGLSALLLESGYAIETLRYVNPVGALGWFLDARLLHRKHVSAGQLRLYERLVPVLRPLDRIRWPFGASLWCVARRHD